MEVYVVDLASSTGHACTALSVCMAIHGDAWLAQPPMGLKGDSGDEGVRSYARCRAMQGIHVKEA